MSFRLLVFYMGVCASASAMANAFCMCVACLGLHDANVFATKMKMALSIVLCKCGCHMLGWGLLSARGRVAKSNVVKKVRFLFSRAGALASAGK